jgi:lipopolysaccharide transport system ATP-binding protein
MGNFAIRVEGLSKQYHIGGKPERYKALRDRLNVTASVRAARSLLRKVARERNANDENTFWALKEVSFEIKPGEVVGVIGRNGAGKSTLLKILSRITEPTEGYADLKGRVGSLLEVGTGFHPELSGRENIFLNGAILGMRRAEIERRFDEIVAFAEVEKFIDTPVKHFSSGMYLRLAFAVAAHLEPEILLVDEVLAVGDLNFQRKCLGKMEEVAAHGRTVLFVSHNLGAIKELCQKGLLLNNGGIESFGSVAQALMQYSQVITRGEGTLATERGWSDVRVCGQEEGPHGQIRTGEPFAVEATLVVPEEFKRAHLFFVVDDPNNNALIHNFADLGDLELGSLSPGRYQVRAEIPPLWLMPNLYTMHLKMIGRGKSGGDERFLSERSVIDVRDGTKQSAGKVKATIIPPVKWSIAPNS